VRGSVALTPPRTAIRRLALARMISLAGTGAAFSALAYIVFQRAGESSVWASVVFLVSFGANALCSPLGGALGDHLDRRKVLIASELAAGAGFVLLAFMDSPLSLVIVATVTSALEAPIWPVSTAAVPNLIGDEDLSWANGLIALGRNLGFLVGPIAGGALVSLFAPDNTPGQLSVASYWVFGLNALSFVIAAGIWWSIRGRFSEEPDHDQAKEQRGLMAGARFLVRDRVLRTITLAWIVLLLGAGASLVAEIELAESFDAGAIGYATLSAMWAGGAAVGSLIASRTLNARREPAAMALGVVVVGVGLGFVSLAGAFVVACALTLLAGLGEGASDVAENGIIQRRTPDAVRASVVGVSEALVLGAFALSFAFAGPLVEAIGPRGAYAIAGVSCLAAAGVLAMVLKDMGRPAPFSQERAAAPERPAGSSAESGVRPPKGL